MKTKTYPNSVRRTAAAGLVAVFLFLLVGLPVSAEVKPLRNAFNPRGFFVTLKSTGQPEWLRSAFTTGYYGSGGGQGTGGGGGGGGGQGANPDKDDLGHSNVQYVGKEAGLDYVDAADVDTIYSVYDHNPTPGKNFMIGFYKDEQAASLQEIPNFTGYIGTPKSGSNIVVDPTGGQGWKVPIQLDLGKELPNGTREALAPGTLYEFAYLRGNQANNGMTCVLMPGDAEGTYKGYLYNPNSFTEEERAVYEASKYDEYEFITAILPEGTSSDESVDHQIESVPMRYHIQTFADLTSWTSSGEYKEAETFLASVAESDYASGKYARENVEALRATMTELQREANEEVRYQLQKDAEWTIKQMVEDLKKALETAKQPKVIVNFEKYNASLANAERVYNDVKNNTGTAVGQYLPEPVEALNQAIGHAKSTINDTSTQAAVDAEATALDNAATNALQALVRPAKEVIFQDDTTGIAVTAMSDSLPENASLVVREVVNTSGEYRGYVARISPTPTKASVYRILFYDGVDVVYPTQSVKVQIPVSTGLEQTEPSVYYLDNSGGAVKLNASAPTGYRIFDTKNLGTFAVAGAKQSNTPTPQPTNAPRSTTRTRRTTRTTRTTTRTTTRRTTRIIRTTRNNNNDQNRRNEMTSSTVRQTQAVQPTTMTTTSPAPTSAQDTSNLEQTANHNTLLYIALAIAGIGIGAAAIEFWKDRNGSKEEDDIEL